MRDSLKFLSGGIVTYVIVAACSSSTALRDRMESMSSGGDRGNAGGEFGDAQGEGGSSGGSKASDTAGAGGGIFNPVPEAQAHQSGSRIKAKWYVGDDDSREFAGWVDEEYGDCSYRQYGSDPARCLPVGAVGVYYADADCTELVTTKSCGSPSEYATVVENYPSDICDPSVSVHPVEGDYSGELWIKVGGGSCNETTQEPCDSGDCKLVRLGDSIPLSSFVSATTEID